MQKLPIGIQSFRRIRTEDYLYVDKTEQIYRFLQAADYTLCCRPPRFGKSLLLSTIQALYQGKKELFKGLWIENQWRWEKQPVIYLDFNRLDYLNNSLEQSLIREIQQIAESFSIQLSVKDSAKKSLEVLIESLAERDAGLMIAPTGEIKVLEYNCRFGDPETQPIMMRLKSDLVALCEAALTQDLANIDTEWDERSALGVVLAAGGYPGSYAKGDIISGLPTIASDHSKVFHAGTQQVDGHTVTAGGRVLCACALGDDIKQAQENAYTLTKQVSWDKVYYRTDIGFKALK